MPRKKWSERIGLDPRMIHFLQLGDDEKKQGYNLSKQYISAVNSGKAFLKDLEILAQTLPEKRREKLFTAKQLSPLVDAVLGFVKENDRYIQKLRDDVDLKRIFEVARMLNKESFDALQILSDLVDPAHYRFFREEVERMKLWIEALSYGIYTKGN